MTRAELFQNIKKKRSFLCIGLDTDLTKIPQHLLEHTDPIFKFNKQIIDATYKYCVSYKINTAFYEAEGLKGWKSLEKTIKYLKKPKFKNIFTIADAKRGDIGNTSKMYAKAFLENLNFDSITVAPYMGEDSVTPFLECKNKWVILLALTSNKGAEDFQISRKSAVGDQQFLFEEVLEKSSKWGSCDNMMYVVGATKTEMLKEVRSVVPDHFLLVPGVGAQGGSLEQVAKFGMNKECGLLVNASRSIIYASEDSQLTTNFVERAAAEARKLQEEMEGLLRARGLVK